MRPKWVPNWGLTLWQWLLFEWWIKILFAIRNYQFLCSTTQICAQHGVLNENFLQKVAAKFNLTVFRGSFSRLTFWVRRRTCLESYRVPIKVAPEKKVFGHFLLLDGSIWTETMLYDQGISLRRSGYPTCLYSEKNWPQAPWGPKKRKKT